MGTTAPGRKKIRPPFGRQQACGQKRPPLRTAASVYAHIFYSISYFFAFVNRLLHIFGHFSPNNAKPHHFSKRNSTHTRIPVPQKSRITGSHAKPAHDPVVSFTNDFLFNPVRVSLYTVHNTALFAPTAAHGCRAR